MIYIKSTNTEDKNIQDTSAAVLHCGLDKVINLSSMPHKDKASNFNEKC